MTPRCDDGTLPNIPIVQWWNYLRDATGRAQRQLEYQPETIQVLRDMGFKDVEDQVIRLPSNQFWPEERAEKLLGRAYNMGLQEAVDAFSVGPLTRMAGWSLHNWRRYEQEVLEAFNDKNVHVYHEL